MAIESSPHDLVLDPPVQTRLEALKPWSLGAVSHLVLVVAASAKILTQDSLLTKE